MSHVDVKNMKPTKFEDEYYDEYEYYNLTDKYAGELTSPGSVRFVFRARETHCFSFSVAEGSARKGRTKKEASDNTNRNNPAGHERKIVEKLQNSEKKDKE